MTLADICARLDAVELEDGDWAYYANETSSWWVVDTDDLLALGEYLTHDDSAIRADAYSHWCAGVSGEEMPEGWEPYRIVPADD